jgi:transposase
VARHHFAGLRRSGLVAPLVLDGPMTGEAFLAYVGQFLAPALKKGNVVVLGNLRAHKVAGVREAIRAAGASLLYPPDLNPLEQLLAKLPVSAVKPRMLELEDRKNSRKRGFHTR